MRKSMSSAAFTPCQYFIGANIPITADVVLQQLGDAQGLPDACLPRAWALVKAKMTAVLAERLSEYTERSLALGGSSPCPSENKE